MCADTEQEYNHRGVTSRFVPWATAAAVAGLANLHHLYIATQDWCFAHPSLITLLYYSIHLATKVPHMNLGLKVACMVSNESNFPI